MREVIRYVFCILVSVIFVAIGYPFYTWQFWAFGVPILILYRIIEEAFLPKKR